MEERTHEWGGGGEKEQVWAKKCPHLLALADEKLCGYSWRTRGGWASAMATLAWVQGHPQVQPRHQGGGIMTSRRLGTPILTGFVCQGLDCG